MARQIGFTAGKNQEAFIRAMCWGLAGISTIFLTNIADIEERDLPIVIAFYCFAMALAPLVAAGYLMNMLMDPNIKQVPLACGLIPVLLFMLGAVLAVAGVLAFIWNYDRTIANTVMAVTCGVFVPCLWFIIKMPGAMSNDSGTTKAQ